MECYLISQHRCCSCTMRFLICQIYLTIIFLPNFIPCLTSWLILSNSQLYSSSLEGLYYFSKHFLCVSFHRMAKYWYHCSIFIIPWTIIYFFSLPLHIFNNFKWVVLLSTLTDLLLQYTHTHIYIYIYAILPFITSFNSLSTARLMYRNWFSYC